MRIAIIGAGISGLIAEGALSNMSSEIIVFDRSIPKLPILGQPAGHKAVMRLRDDRIKQYVNCKLKRISVYKAVYHDGELYDKPNMILNNLYSLKLYGRLGDRSLGTLGKVDRYLLTDISGLLADNHKLTSRLVTANRDKTLVFNDQTYSYDVCISTIPMPSLLDLLCLNYNVKFSHTQINITRATLNIESDVHQTIYFTNDLKQFPYRVTIEGRYVIAESLDRCTESLLDQAMQAFGLNRRSLKDIAHYTQNMGKMMPIDDNTRRKIMMDLTNEYNVYSFGRFATWRPLRIDQTLDDIEKIKMFIKVSNYKYYDDK